MGVSIIPCFEWMFKGLTLSVGRITRQEIQQPGVPSHITTGPRPWTGGDTAPIPKSHSTALAYPAPPWGATAKERWCLRESVANADKAMAVRALVELVIDKHGRATVLGLEPEEAKICVETLDYVSCDLCLPPFAASDGLFRASQRAPSDPPRRGLFFSC